MSRTGLEELKEKIKERKLMEEQDGVKIVDGLILNKPKSVELVVQKEQSQSSNYASKLKKIKLPQPKPKVDTQDKVFIDLDKEQPFSERYTRVTTYFENSINDKIKTLKQDGMISSITSLVNVALQEFLNKHSI